MAGEEQLLRDLNSNSEEVDDTVETTSQTDKTQEKNIQGDAGEKLNRLPLSRIKSIIKMDPDVKKASQDAVFVLTKAAELFIQHLARDTAVKTLGEKKKTITRQHLDHVCFTKDCYSFLEGVLESFDS